MKFFKIDGKDWLSAGEPISKMIHMDTLMDTTCSVPYELKTDREKFLINQLKYHGLRSAVIHAKRIDYLVKELYYKVTIIHMNHEALGINCSHPNSINTKLVIDGDKTFVECDCLYCLNHIKYSVLDTTSIIRR